MPGSNALERLVIVASGDCNLRCSYCRLGRSARTAPWTSVRPALDAILRSREPAVEIVFTGGEPLLALPLVQRAVSHVRSAGAAHPGVRYTLATNGLLLTPSVVAFLARHRFDVRLSLDGAREVQERRSPGTSAPLSELLRRLRRDAPRFLSEHVTVVATVTPATVPLLADSIRFLLDRGAANISLGAAMGTGRAPVRARLLDRQFRKVFDLMRERLERTGRVPLVEFRKSLPLEPHERTGWVCGAVSGRSIVVDADGSRVPCLMATRTYSPSPPPALAPHLEALRAWASAARRVATRRDAARLALFRADAPRYSSYSRCAECRWQAACTVCPLAAAQERRWEAALRVPDFLCAFSRTLLKYRERFPVQD